MFRGDTSGWEDRPFYLEIIRQSGQPELDVGCGTGRLLLDYLSLGMDIDGVDISPEMLDLCRQKAARMGIKPMLYESPMETMQLPRRYKTIIVPSSSFQFVVEPLQARKAIANLYHNLLPNGVLAMPFMLEWKNGEPLENDWQLNGEKANSEDGVIIRRWSKDRYDPQTQLMHNEDKYEVLRDGVIIVSEQHVRSPAIRQYSQQQAYELYIEAGFVDVKIYHEFTFVPVSVDDNLFSITARRPS